MIEYVWNLILIDDETNGSISDHENFFIHDDLFDIIQSTYQENKISLNNFQMNPMKMNLNTMQHIFFIDKYMLL